jgi:hypothetical protein
VDWTTVAHPHTNGQLECGNDLILQGLNLHIITQESEDVHTQLRTRARKWAVEVPLVL